MSGVDIFNNLRALNYPKSSEFNLEIAKWANRQNFLGGMPLDVSMSYVTLTNMGFLSLCILH